MLLKDHVDRVVSRMEQYKKSHSHRVFARYFTSLWGDREVSSIISEELEEWSLRRRGETSERTGRTISAATVKAETSFLRQIWRDAKLPWPGEFIPRVTLNNQRLFVFERNHESQIKTRLRPYDWDIFRFMVLTGLRRSEVFRLRAKDFSFKPGQESIHVSTSKTGKGRRNPLYPEAVAIAKKYCQRCKSPEEYLWFKSWNQRECCGQQWSYNVIRPVLDQVCGREFQLRDTRHTFGSRLAESQAHPTVIRDLMGHSSLAMTNRYLQTSDRFRRDSLLGAKL